MKKLIGFLFIWLILFPNQKTFSSPKGTMVEKSNQNVYLRAQVDKAIIKPGETLYFKLRLFSPKEGESLYIPEIGDRIEGFRIIDFGKDGPKVDDDQKVFERWYKLEVDLSGSYVLPAITISFKDKKGKKQSVSSSEIFIEVRFETPGKKGEENKKTGTKKIDDIRDIKSIKNAPFPMNLIYYLLGGISILGLAIGLFLWKRKNKKGQESFPLPPHEKALEELAVLKKGTHNLSKYEQRKTFYFAISGIVRTYVEDSYQFPARERTQEEIKREIGDLKDLNFEQQKVFLGILKEADLVKFASLERNEEQGKGLLENAKSFVLETMPQEIETQSEEDSVI
jgi:hypothetical protein